MKGSIALKWQILTCVKICFSGADGINKARSKRNDDVTARDGSIVHASCQKKYTDEKEIQRHNKRRTESLEDIPKRKSQRIEPSQTVTDSNMNCCLFCERHVNFDPPKYGLECDASKVKTDGKISFPTTIKNCCKVRQDELAFKVNGKIEFFESDLHAADVVYHRSCSVNFRTGRQIPVQYSGKEKNKSGRPENVNQRNAFLLTCNYFENNDEQLSLSDLISKMNEFLKETDDLKL